MSLLRILGFSIALLFANTVALAENGIFDGEYVNLPDVTVGNQAYSARLRLIPDSTPLTFELAQASLLDKISDSETVFSNNVLHIHAINVGDGVYAADLELMTGSEPLRFQLTAITIITPPPEEPNQGLNGELTGEIFIGNRIDGPWIMDLTTGRYTPIPGVDWDEPDNFPGLAKFSAYPADDGTEFVETVKNCKDTGTLSFDDCFIFHDQQGGVVGRFDIPHGDHGTDGPAKISLDHQFIAVPVADTGIFGSLKLYSRNGVLLGESNEEVLRAEDFDWLPDNRLVYSSGQTIYLTGIESAKGTPFAKFPEENGRPSQLAVSPDGTQLAFTLVTDANSAATHGTTWIFNLDGSRLVQLTNTPDPNDPSTTVDDPTINFPTWSPNGQWIAVVKGVGALAPIGSESKVELFVVPSDGENVMLTRDEPTTARPIYSYFNETSEFTDPGEGELSTQFDVQGELAWLP